MQTFTLEDIVNLQNQGKFKEAEQLYNTCLEKHPDDWAVLYHLAGLFMLTDRNGLAAMTLERALDIEKGRYEVYSNLGVLYRTLDMYSRSRPLLERAVKLAAGKDADVYVNLGSLFVNDGGPERGEEILRSGYAISPENHLVNWNLSLCLLEQGKWKDGWECYAHGKYPHKERERSERPLRWANFPEWDKEKSRVLVYGEQGLGDEIMFYSMLPDIQQDAESVLLECHPRLENIAKRSFPDIEIVPTRKLDYLDKSLWFDHRIASGDLGRFYRNKIEDFPGTPYLKVDPDLVEHYRAKLEECGDGPYYGIGWRGGYLKTRKSVRSINLETLEPILKQQGTFISMQYDDKADGEVEKYCEKTGLTIHHWPDVVRHQDYDHTAALAMALDSVICVNTSLVHLCGAIGASCWSLTPSRPAWRYQIAGDMPWYNSVKLVRQLVPESWDGPISEVCKLMQENANVN